METLNLYLCDDVQTVSSREYFQMLACVPKERCDKAKRFLKKNDCILSMAAYLLLRYALRKDYHIADIPQFSYGAYGKPYFQEMPDLHFNISHTDGAVMCGICKKSEVGVDVQRYTKINDISYDIFLTDKEQWEVKKRGNQNSDLIRLWALKEAYLKCTGVGLHAGINKINFSDWLCKNVFQAGKEYFRSGECQGVIWASCGYQKSKVHNVSIHSLLK